LEFVEIRTAVPEEGVLGAVRSIIRRLDPGLPITQVRTMRQSVDLATALPRRRREFGLRMALGARGSDVSRALIRNAARLILAGSTIGALCPFAGASALGSVLYGVRPHDPAVIAAAPVLLATIAFLACLAPAHRAASVEPMAALRQE
jgi:ABC-type lipoprotein release transport system permease subunit